MINRFKKGFSSTKLFLINNREPRYSQNIIERLVNHSCSNISPPTHNLQDFNQSRGSNLCQVWQKRMAPEPQFILCVYNEVLKGPNIEMK